MYFISLLSILWVQCQECRLSESNMKSLRLFAAVKIKKVQYENPFPDGFVIHQDAGRTKIFDSPILLTTKFRKIKYIWMGN